MLGIIVLLRSWIGRGRQCYLDRSPSVWLYTWLWHNAIALLRILAVPVILCITPCNIICPRLCSLSASNAPLADSGQGACWDNDQIKLLEPSHFLWSSCWWRLWWRPMMLRKMMFGMMTIVTTMMTINCGPRQIVTALPTTLLPSIIQVATRSQRNVQYACNRVVWARRAENSQELELSMMLL